MPPRLCDMFVNKPKSLSLHVDLNADSVGFLQLLDYGQTIAFKVKGLDCNSVACL